MRVLDILILQLFGKLSTRNLSMKILHTKKFNANFFEITVHQLMGIVVVRAECIRRDQVGGPNVSPETLSLRLPWL